MFSLRCLVPAVVAFTATIAACDGGRHPVAGPVADLPLVEVPVATPGHLVAVLMTGDGGWAAGDRGLSSALAARGVPVVGLSSPRYLEDARTPDQSARDLERILDYYLTAWRRDSAIVIGYSRGADIVPFMISRLPRDLRRRVALVVLLGPSRWAGFEFHTVDLVRDVRRPGDLPVATEVERLRGIAVLCVYGRHDRETICPTLPAGVARLVVRDGGHAIGGGEGPALADTILSALPPPR